MTAKRQGPSPPDPLPRGNLWPHIGDAVTSRLLINTAFLDVTLQVDIEEIQTVGDNTLPRLAAISDKTPVSTKPLLELYAEKRPNLVRYFATRLRSVSEAEDLIQDLFFKVERLEGHDIGPNPSALLFQIAHNLMLDRLRSQRRANARDHTWLQGHSTTPMGQLVADDPSAETMVASREQLKTLLRLLDDLPEKTARAFRLHKLEGLSHADTAQAMGISRSTVEKHISAALKRLMKARL